MEGKVVEYRPTVGGDLRSRSCCRWASTTLRSVKDLSDVPDARDQEREDVDGRLHDLVLCQTAVVIGIHGVSGARRDVSDKAETEGPSSVLVALELGDGRLGGVGRVESDNAGASGSTTRLVLNLGLLNLAYGGEQLNEIVVAGRPREL